MMTKPTSWSIVRVAGVEKRLLSTSDSFLNAPRSNRIATSPTASATPVKTTKSEKAPWTELVMLLDELPGVRLENSEARLEKYSRYITNPPTSEQTWRMAYQRILVNAVDSMSAVPANV